MLIWVLVLIEYICTYTCLYTYEFRYLTADCLELFHSNLTHLNSKNLIILSLIITITFSMGFILTLNSLVGSYRFSTLEHTPTEFE